MVKIRLMRLGRKHRPYYRIVVAEATRKRSGKALAFIGQYDPLTEPKLINIDLDKYNEWVGHGAQPTDTVRSLVKKYSQANT